MGPILKVLGPCLTLGAYSRCMNVTESVCNQVFILLSQLEMHRCAYVT